MLMPSIFGENLFDDWMDFSFPDIDKALYGKHAKNEMSVRPKMVMNWISTCLALRKMKSQHSWITDI